MTCAMLATNVAQMRINSKIIAIPASLRADGSKVVIARAVAGTDAYWQIVGADGPCDAA
jgi:hypothetical protein